MHIKYIDKNYEDLCYKSIEHLEHIVRKYLLEEYNIKDPWILDSMHGTRLKKKNDIEEIVFFGSYIQRFLESGCWNFEKARFWVLSHRVKDFMVSEFNLNEKFFNVIPRNKLVSLSTKQSSFPSLDEEISLVYAGRLSESKNIEALLYTTYHLQIIHNLNINLYLIGEFDNMSSIYSIKEDSFSYEDRIHIILNNLNWKKRPVKLAETDPNEWTRKEFINPVFISLSHFVSEDFGVSSMQAQEKGWPCILSDWGGHADVYGENIQLVPFEFISEGSGHYHLLESKTKKAANYIIKNFKNNKREFSETIINSEYIKLEAINKKRLKFVGENGNACSLYLLRGQLNKFRAQEVGDAFFKRLESSLSGKKLDVKPDSVVILNDLSAQIPDVKRKSLCLLEENTKNGLTTEFIPLNNIMWKANLTKTQNCKFIHIPFYTPSMKDFINFLSDFVNSNTTINIHTDDLHDPFPSNVKILRSII